LHIQLYLSLHFLLLANSVAWKVRRPQKTRPIQCGSGVTADPIFLSRCERRRVRGSLVKIRGMTRTQNFEIRTSLMLESGHKSNANLLQYCNIKI